MIAYGAERATGRHTEAARAFKLWEQCQPREVPREPSITFSNVNGADFTTSPEEAERLAYRCINCDLWSAKSLWERGRCPRCRGFTRPELSAPVEKPYSKPLLTDYKLVSPRCGNCSHTDAHYQAAGQDVCTHTDADGTRRCGCENYVAEFDLPRIVVRLSAADHLDWLLDLEQRTITRMR